MADAAQLFAVLAATAFTSAALYVSLVEHPARSKLDPAAELAQWKPSYKRAALFQSALVLAGSAAAWAAHASTADPAWKVGGALLFSNLPWTLLVIMPTNKQLLAMPRGDARSRSLLVGWIHLHHCRTALGLLATGTMAAALLSRG
jgi:hypothetical protein